MQHLAPCCGQHPILAPPSLLTFYCSTACAACAATPCDVQVRVGTMASMLGSFFHEAINATSYL